MKVSDRWFRLLLRLYPADFRDEMGDAVVETLAVLTSASLDRPLRPHCDGAAASRLASPVGVDNGAE
jgi:hypothetical protein